MESFPFVVIFSLSSLFHEIEMNINADNGANRQCCDVHFLLAQKSLDLE